MLFQVLKFYFQLYLHQTRFAYEAINQITSYVFSKLNIARINFRHFFLSVKYDPFIKNLSKINKGVIFQQFVAVEV